MTVRWRRSFRTSFRRLNGITEMCDGGVVMSAGINSKRAFVESASSRRRARRSLNVTAQRRILASARKYLREHSDRPIYADEVREALNVSQASLTDAFLSRLGVTPERFLALRRLRLV